jgi:glycosyltransferase involved in cell wall biosynthesis
VSREPRSLSIWLITVGEPLPLPGRRERPWRTGLLAQELTERGHKVLWWTSNFDHITKEYFVRRAPTIVVNDCLELQFLDGMPYEKNVSLARLQNHRQIGNDFAVLSRARPKPDVILCSFPTIELSLEAARYGCHHTVPVILDVRDLWPDIFADVAPAGLRSLIKFASIPMMRQARAAFRACSAITGVSEQYLAWGLRKAGRKQWPTDRVFPLGYRRNVAAPSAARALATRLKTCGVDTRQPIAAFVGSFGRSYDLATVIRAARELETAGETSVQFVFCGRGENEADWRALADGLTNVFFPGWLNAEELAVLLSLASIGLAAYAPGAPQGIPNKVIEYLSADLPVLCSLPGESRELLEVAGCGLYYAAGDSSQLAELIWRVLTTVQLRTTMRHAAHSVFERKYSADVVYRDMGNYIEAFIIDNDNIVTCKGKGIEIGD